MQLIVTPLRLPRLKAEMRLSFHQTRALLFQVSYLCAKRGGIILASVIVLLYRTCVEDVTDRDGPGGWNFRDDGVFRPPHAELLARALFPSSCRFPEQSANSPVLCLMKDA